MPKVESKPLSQIPQHLLDFFWTRVITGPAHTCWEWQGATRRKGYGYCADERHRQWAAHRIAFYIGYGIDPLDICVCHTCDNPLCVNWNHLFLGTYEDNNQDRQQKGRTRLPKPEQKARGDHAPCHKLTSNQIPELRQLRAQGYSYPQLGRHFGIAAESARAVILGKTWRHIT